MDPYKARKMAKWVAIIVAVTMILTSFSFVFFLPSLFGEENYTAYGASSTTEDLDKYMKLIQTNYKDQVDLEKLINGSYEGAINSLDDPYSVFYRDEQQGEDFMNQVLGEFAGIGVYVQMQGDACVISGTIPGGAAEKVGIKGGDIIAKIDGVSVAGKSLDEITQLLKGKVGTKVAVTVKRNAHFLNFTMIRKVVTTASVAFEMKANQIGYIQIISFDGDTQVEFANARMTLLNKGAKAFVIDLRNNGGGIVNGAVDIANQLLPKKGPIVHFMQQGKITETIQSSGAEYVLPTVVLVNGNTASASEILVGALKDSHAAKVVGTQTYGKGIIQSVIPVNATSSMKLSTHYYLTPNQTKIDKIGITPDYVVANTANINEEALIKEYSKFAPMKEEKKPKKGDTGLNVFGAQQRLALLGYHVEISGTMDANTTAAVNQFQKDAGLKPYGVLDYTTMATLDKKTAQMILGVKEDQDLQLDKALEVLR
ncbi:MAG: S41 family peptidase [Anaerovorax sp.]